MLKVCSKHVENKNRSFCVRRGEGQKTLAIPFFLFLAKGVQRELLQTGKILKCFVKVFGT